MPDTQGPSSLRDNPILASFLLSDGDLDDVFDEGGHETSVNASSGNLGLDDLVGNKWGGKVGKVVGVSGERGVGKLELSLVLLSEHLLKSTHTCAVVIDATGHLDVLRLYSNLVHSLQLNPSLLTLHQVEGDESLEDIAERMLERVKIMRVFNLVGLEEAIEEVVDALETPKETELEPKSRGKDVEVGAEVKEVPLKPVRREVVQDSEDEGEDEDKEMLFDSTPLSPPPPTPRHLEQQPRQLNTGTDDEDRIRDSSVSFLLIDNIAHVIRPLLKENYTQATTLLNNLLHSLKRLTRIHKLTTILLNPAIPISGPVPNHAQSNSISKPAPENASPHTGTSQQSTFASNNVVPALGMAFLNVLDLHLLVSKLPRWKSGVRAFYSGKENTVETVKVVEVLEDRSGGRVGRFVGVVESQR